jgi:hypothetical protein
MKKKTTLYDVQVRLQEERRVSPIDRAIQRQELRPRRPCTPASLVPTIFIFSGFFLLFLLFLLLLLLVFVLFLVVPLLVCLFLPQFRFFQTVLILQVFVIHLFIFQMNIFIFFDWKQNLGFQEALRRKQLAAKSYLSALKYFHQRLPAVEDSYFFWKKSSSRPLFCLCPICLIWLIG